MPYKIVLGKLKGGSPPLTEMLRSEVLIDVLYKLFPKAIISRNPPLASIETNPIAWEDEWDITPVDIYNIIKKGKMKNNTAPGLDGIRSLYWKRINGIMINTMAKLLTTCIKEYKFPDQWKVAHLVLLPKGKLCMDQPKVKPICLLSEAGKIMEKVLVRRITDWMENNPDAALTFNQFGFCRGRSTNDALIEIKNFIEFTHRNEGIVIAISLDISNAFNSLQWNDIKTALREKSIPEYTCRIIDSYLSNRYIEFPSGRGSERCVMEAGVPQRSVLGPLPWNITYDQVLRGVTEDSCRMLGYADDTFILVTGGDKDTIKRRAEIQVAATIRKIKELNLKVAPEKTEIVLFENNKEVDTNLTIKIEDKSIKTKRAMKYLGIMIDDKLNFLQHVKYVQGKVNKITGALCRIMPNLRGPDESKRRLQGYQIAYAASSGGTICIPTTLAH